MDRSSPSSEISFHGLPNKGKRPSIRKHIASSLPSQVIVLFLRKSHLQRDIWQTFFRQYFSAAHENPLRNFLESSEKTAANYYFSKVADFEGFL